MFDIIERHGNSQLINLTDVDTAFTFEVSEENPRDFENTRNSSDSLNWDKQYHLGKYRVHPYGDYNDLPNVIKEVVQNNYLAPGTLTKKAQLLWGKGPKLYEEKFENGKLVRRWKDDKEIQRWLDSFDAEKYLAACIVDYNHLQGTFTKFRRNRGGRVGVNKISRLEHLSPEKSRLASPINNVKPEATHLITTDWNFNHLDSIMSFKSYPLFDPKQPFKNTSSAYYSNIYSFCTDYYTVPDIYGSLEWLRRSTATPLIFKHLSRNSLNIKYHIESPSEFWAQKRDLLIKKYQNEEKTWKEKYFREYKTNFLRQVSKVLSGLENTGKFWHTEKVIRVEGGNIIEQGWTIKPIEQNIKDFVESHIKISDRADRALSAGIGLHGALGNINESARSNSGSEQLYALKNYLQTGIDMPEMIVTKPINFAIKANWPNKNLKLGFYHDTDMAKAEEETTPSQRQKNIS